MARRDYYNDPEAPPANSIVPAVTAVVTNDDGDLLLIQRTDNGRWALPGGGLDVGESVSDAVIREVNEETGLDVEITGLVGIYSDPHHVIAYDDGEVRQQFSLCFRARPVRGELRGSSESTDVRWVSRKDLESLNMHPAQRMRVTHGLEEGSKAPYIG